MKSLKYIILVLLFSNIGISRAQIFETDIQFVSLKDSILINSIDSLIDYEVKTDTLFSNSKGYFLLNIDYEVRNGVGPPSSRIDTVLQYNLMKSYGHPDKSVNQIESFYPPYFTIINRRLICIQIDGLTESKISFTEKSKKMYLDYLSNFLGDTGDKSRMILWDLNYSYNIYILRNGVGSLSPLIRKE
ncbi:hypothetical protein EI427_21630 [Flammeovirga pectinis]|uniref:Uncharacterized protein n=1 Tax=Flammeovirga pectinis TaxID=2494373 RepID=A0A3S9P9H2_9BACT|nr:hypothetical protein [Flammeovirga pectinis]AZQ64829.1 hypothetical protein EI427_21630 [Flammeovirga pectinis]